MITLPYIDHFEDWVKEIGGELQENYDFEKELVSAGDFYYIQSEESESEEAKLNDYTIYYFDVDAAVLYYFHNNV